MKNLSPARALPTFLGAALLTLAALRAQSPTPSRPDNRETVQLDAFTVSASAQTEYGVTSAAGATRLNTPIREIPQSISVLTKEFMDAIGATNLADAVIWAPSVSPRQNVFDGTVVRSFLTTRTYNDGVRNFNGNYQSDLANFDRIEIIKGPAAAVIGTGEAGGFVNRVSKKPLEKAQGYVRLQVGSYDFKRTEIDATGPVTADKSVLYRTVIAYQNNETFLKGQSQERTLFAPQAMFRPFRATSVLVQYEYQDIHDPWNFGQPFYAVGTGGTAAAPKEAAFIFSPIYQGESFSGMNNVVHNLRATVTQRLNRIVQARLVTNGFKGDIQGVRTIMGSHTVNATTKHVQSARTYDGVAQFTKTFNTQLDLVAIYDVGNIHNSTLLGAEYIWNYEAKKNHTGAMTALDLEAPVYGGFPATIANTGDQLQQTNQEGFYLQQQSKFFRDKIVFTAGMRYDRAWITTHNYLTKAFTRTAKAAEDWVNAPRVGATFALTPELSAYAIWSQQESPAAQQRQFPNSSTDFTILTSKATAKLKEVGLKGDLFGGKFTVAANYFDLNQAGFFRSTVVSVGTTQVSTNVIVPGALVRGVEFEAVAAPFAPLRIVSSYTHNFVYRDASTGVPTAVVPKDKITGFINYRLTKKLSANVGGIYVGPQFSVNGAQIYKRGGQTRLDAGGAYTFNQSWNASVRLENITDKFFVAGLVSTTSNSVTPPRNWKLTVNRRW